MKCLTIEETIQALKNAYKGVPDETKKHLDGCPKCLRTQKEAQDKLLDEARKKDGIIAAPYVEYKPCDKCQTIGPVYYLTMVRFDCPYVWLCAKCFREYRKGDPRPKIQSAHVDIHTDDEIISKVKREKAQNN